MGEGRKIIDCKSEGRESRKEASPPGVPESGEERSVTEKGTEGHRGSREGGRKRQKYIEM